MYPYILIRSRRKSISVSINDMLEVVVRCPSRMAKRDVDAFVHAHNNWITVHLQRMRERLSSRSEFTFADGQEVWYKGQLYPVTSEAEFSGINLLDERMRLSGSPEERSTAYMNFLRERAKEYLPQRVAFYSPAMGVSPSSVKITAAKTRWGSCSGKNAVCFSLRLMCLTERLIDYVVVHELAHCKQHNHSRLFYAEIAAILPDYRQREREMKEFHSKLPY